ncbi:nitroreductase family protein [Streptomyces osmaniensis]|uniref:Nitroreductase domain-containing protein n=1 Tax=Streptomyces osmaniensis TaxID=593134 RepID=A0ABP6YZV8_9ACTN
MGNQVYGLPPTADQLLEDLVRACAADLAGPTAGSVPSELRLDAPSGTRYAYALPTAGPPTRSVSAVLNDRRTIRDFAPGPLPAKVLGEVLKATLSQDRRMASGETEAGNGLTPVVVVRAATGIEPGVYEAGAAGNCLYWHGALSQEAWRLLFFQSQLESAPVLILMAGSPAAAWHRDAAQGYLRLVRRAGAAAYAGWLAALQQGYDGCLMGSTLPSPQLNEAAGFDPAGRRPLIALAIGLRVESPG